MRVIMSYTIVPVGHSSYLKHSSPHKKTATGLNPMAVVSCYCSLELSSRRSLLIEGCLGLRNDAVESIDVVHGEVCKNLAVYLDIGGLEAFNET